jgi:hypothetical protein
MNNVKSKSKKIPLKTEHFSERVTVEKFNPG